MAYAGLGIEIAAPILLCTYLGYRADIWLGTEPWLLVVGALLGISATFYNLFRRVLPSRKGSDDGEGR